MGLIDADALREIVEIGLRENPHKDGFARRCHETEYMHFLCVIGRQPTIAPVAHGRWIHTDSHLWYKTDDGRIDEWRLDVDYHNGPECQVCGYTPCMHCHPDYMEDKCPKGHYICSECANESVDGHEKFCPNCGAKMDLEA